MHSQESVQWGKIKVDRIAWPFFPLKLPSGSDIPRLQSIFLTIPFCVSKMQQIREDGRQGRCLTM